MLLVFDFDGTVTSGYYPEGALKSLFTAFAKKDSHRLEVKKSEIEENLSVYFRGAHVKDIVGYICAQTGIEMTTEEVAEMNVRAGTERTEFFATPEYSANPNIISLFEMLDLYDDDYAVASNSPGGRVMTGVRSAEGDDLKRFLYTPMPDPVTGTIYAPTHEGQQRNIYGQPDQDLVACGIKPKPDGSLLKHVATEMGYDPAETTEDILYIGDGLVDVYAAKSAGFRSVGYIGSCPEAYRTKLRVEMFNAGADYVVEDYAEVPQIMAEIKAGIEGKPSAESGWDGPA